MIIVIPWIFKNNYYLPIYEELACISFFRLKIQNLNTPICFINIILVLTQLFYKYFKS